MWKDYLEENETGETDSKTTSDPTVYHGRI